MATSETRFDLTAVHYDGLERPIASTDGIAVSAFRYPTGIEAIRLTNSVGEIVILPTQPREAAGSEEVAPAAIRRRA